MIPYTAPGHWPPLSVCIPFSAPWTSTSWTAGSSTRQTWARWRKPWPDGCTWSWRTSRWNWAARPRTSAGPRTPPGSSWTDLRTCWPANPARRTTRRLRWCIQGSIVMKTKISQGTKVYGAGIVGTPNLSSLRTLRDQWLRSSDWTIELQY